MTLGTKVGLTPGDIVLDWGTAPTFRPISIVAKWWPISATAQLLYCDVLSLTVHKVTNNMVIVHVSYILHAGRECC